MITIITTTPPPPPPPAPPAAAAAAPYLPDYHAHCYMTNKTSQSITRTATLYDKPLTLNQKLRSYPRTSKAPCREVPFMDLEPQGYCCYCYKKTAPCNAGKA